MKSNRKLVCNGGVLLFEAHISLSISLKIAKIDSLVVSNFINVYPLKTYFFNRSSLKPQIILNHSMLSRRALKIGSFKLACFNQLYKFLEDFSRRG
jgi:hypothetical protein